MTERQCIYCKRKKTSKEHAFPESLLHRCLTLRKNTPSWIIRQVCKDCNSKLGKLDEILTTKSPMAFIWRIIKSEWQSTQNRESKNAAFYNARAHGILPVHLFYPDDFYDDLIILHEEIGTSAPGFYPTLLGRARAPQIVLIQYADGQTAEQIAGENRQKWISGEMSVIKSNEHDGVYCIFDNSYVFDPHAVKYFTANRDREREFAIKFMKKHKNARIDLRVIFSDEPNDTMQLEEFCTRLKAETKEEIDARRFEPKEATENYVMTAADKKAIPFIKRAIAKIAFHCFLYSHRDFEGNEPIFEGIRTFISENGKHQTPNGEEIMTGLSVPRNYFWPSNEHFHILRFYVHGDNIICQIVFFSGLWLGASNSDAPEPLACEIILAGDSEKARRGNPEERCIPFYVHGKSQLKRRIIT